MVPRERIELSASSLPMTRSTTELPRRCVQGAPYCRVRAHCQARLEGILSALSLSYLSAEACKAKAFRMNEETGKNLSREERLAAKLRENLRRRKAQSREQASDSGAGGVSKPDSES